MLVTVDNGLTDYKHTDVVLPVSFIILFLLALLYLLPPVLYTCTHVVGVNVQQLK